MKLWQMPLIFIHTFTPALNTAKSIGNPHPTSTPFTGKEADLDPQGRGGENKTGKGRNEKGGWVAETFLAREETDAHTSL